MYYLADPGKAKGCSTQPSLLMHSKVMGILVKGGFYLGVELHRDGYAPTACAAGLFFFVYLHLSQDS